MIQVQTARAELESAKLRAEAIKTIGQAAKITRSTVNKSLSAHLVMLYVMARFNKLYMSQLRQTFQF